MGEDQRKELHGCTEDPRERSGMEEKRPDVGPSRSNIGHWGTRGGPGGSTDLARRRCVAGILGIDRRRQESRGLRRGEQRGGSAMRRAEGGVRCGEQRGRFGAETRGGGGSLGARRGCGSMEGGVLGEARKSGGGWGMLGEATGGWRGGGGGLGARRGGNLGVRWGGGSTKGGAGGGRATDVEGYDGCEGGDMEGYGVRAEA